MSHSSIKMPSNGLAEQRRHKIAWNLVHRRAGPPDFYTVGYAGTGLADFLSLLKKAGISTLADVRWAPVSRFRPEFSKANLQRFVELEGISYVSRPDLGVPRDVRASVVGQATRDDLWQWYDTNVLPRIAGKNLDSFFNTMEYPAAFMCVEYDPTECHRHRIFLGLERLGLSGLES